MRSWLARLRPVHLVAATALYWVGLALIRLSEPVLTAWRLSQLPPGQGSIEAGFTNSLFHVTMVQAGQAVWSGSIGLGSLVIWLFGPPALLVGAWWMQRETADQPQDDQRPGAAPPSALPASRLDPAPPTRRADDVPAKRRDPHAS